MTVRLDRREYGRRDSNSHGHRGPVRVTKVLIPAASKAAVYTDSTTPAWSLSVSPKSFLSVFFCVNLCQHRRRGFHAAAFGAPGRGAPIPSAFSLHDRPNDFLRSHDSSVVEGVSAPLLRPSRKDKLRLIDADGPIKPVDVHAGLLRSLVEHCARDGLISADLKETIEQNEQRVRGGIISARKCRKRHGVAFAEDAVKYRLGGFPRGDGGNRRAQLVNLCWRSRWHRGHSCHERFELCSNEFLRTFSVELVNADLHFDAMSFHAY